MKETPPKDKEMWEYYQVAIQFCSQFAASMPKTPDEIRAMLEMRKMPEAQFRKTVKASEVLKTVDELAEQVGAEVEASEEEERGWATFKKDEKGLYYEARCVKAHLKDCANILQKTLEVKALKSKLANRVFVVPAKIYIFGPGPVMKTQPDGTETRMVHVITPKGPRSSIKMIDYVLDAGISFNLKVMNDGEITEKILRTIFEYGSEHGMGQERSQDFGRYVDGWTFAKQAVA